MTIWLEQSKIRCTRCGFKCFTWQRITDHMRREHDKQTFTRPRKARK